MQSDVKSLSMMLYNLKIDIGVSHLFLILCCSVYMVILKLTNAWCFIAALVLPLLKIKLTVFSILFYFLNDPIPQVARQMVIELFIPY